MFKFKKIIFILISVLTTMNAVAKTEYFSNIYIGKVTELKTDNDVVIPEEPVIDPLFWTVTNANIAGKYLTFRGVSSRVDQTCIDVNFGQRAFLGNPNGYKKINPNLINSSFCYVAGDLLRRPELLLPTSGKYYFEIKINHYNANILALSALNGSGETFAMKYGSYDSSYSYLYVYNGKNVQWLKASTGPFPSGGTLQFWIDIDNKKILINKLGYNQSIQYNSPILN